MSQTIISDFFDHAPQTYELAEQHLNPHWVGVLRILNFDKVFHRAEGSFLYDEAGEAYLDMHTGEGVTSLGHHHPAVVQALKDVMDHQLPDGIQIRYSALSGLLAKQLAELLPPTLDSVFFTNSGAEAVDTALKFARGATRRPRFVSCERAFHGLSFGPLALAGEDYFQKGFGPMLPGGVRVPFGDLDRLEAELKKKDVAAFISEPIQGRTVALPPEGYFQAAQALCRKYGTLFILDEIQTGLGRTGKMFALEHHELEPDIVLVAKALSGGLVPVGAMITSRKIYGRVLNTLERSYVHHSTYGRNTLAMAAGLATLQVLKDGLVAHAAKMGAYFRARLNELATRYDMIAEVRGEGLMIGVEFGPPRALKLRLNWNMIHAASEGLFAQLVVIPLLKDHRIITMVSGHNDVIKFLPPLTIQQKEIDRFIAAFDAVLQKAHESTGQNWKLILDLARATAKEKLGLGKRPPAEAAWA